MDEWEVGLLERLPLVQAVLELFDRPGGFRDEDRRLAAAAAEILSVQKKAQGNWCAG